MRLNYGWFIVIGLTMALAFTPGCQSGSESDDAATSGSDLDSEMDSLASNQSNADDASTSSPQETASSDDLSEDLDNASSESVAAADKNSDEESSLEEELNAGDNQPPVAANQPTPAPEAENNPPPPVVASDSSSAPTGEMVRITGLDYKANDNGGTVVIQTSSPATFTTRKTAGHQFVIEVQNAFLPKKFKRPYDTKEFSGSVGSINAYQQAGSNVARIVVQLKDPSADMSVQQEGNSLIAMAGRGEVSAEAQPVAQAEEPAVQPEAPAAEHEEQDSDAVADSSEPSTVSGGRSLLTSRSLDDFLNGRIRFSGRPISIQVRETDIREVFNFIAEESGLNIVLTEEVTGKVSLKLRKIPWDQALIVLMQTKQLGYVRQGNILRIAPIASIRREADSTRELLEAQKLLLPLRVKIFNINYAKASDLVTSANAFVSTRGKVQQDARTNSLIVTDLPENIEKVSEVIAKLDSQTPQVLIEGRIVETSETINKFFGINWQYSFGTTDQYVVTSNLANGLASPNVSAQATWGSVTATLRLLESENRLKVLSAPRIVALNNEPAVINQTTSIPIPSQSSTGTVVTNSFIYRDVPLTLTVTPQIASDGNINMQVEITRGVAATTTNGAPPSISTRNAKTRILVKSGDTAVIGGVYQDDTAESEERVPLLSKIPIIGALFRNFSSVHAKNELVMFLTPRILSRSNAFAREGSG